MFSIILDTNASLIQATMSGVAATTNPEFSCHYADNDGTTFTEGSEGGALNGTTTVTMVSSPASGTRRIIKSIILYNGDTAAVTVNIEWYNGVNARTIANVTLAVGDTWTLEGTFNSSGSLKNTSVTAPGGSNTQVQFNDGGVLAGDAGLTYAKATDALTVAGKVVTPYVDAVGSAGGALRNASGTAQVQWGAGGGSNFSIDVAANLNPANANVSLAPTGTGVVTINPATAGTMNNVAIGATTPLAGTFTDITLNAQGDVRFADSDSSNWVAFQAPAVVASNVTWTLPAADGSSNQVLQTNGSGTLSWATVSNTPGGSDTQVQFNDSGSFGGDAGLTYNKTTDVLTVAGAFSAPAGTASAPSITATGDTNTGVFFPAADTVGVTTGGSERMRITSGGFVGIGVTPSVPLDVVAQSSASIARFRGRSSDNIATLEWYDNTNATRYTYISSGPSSSSIWNQANTAMLFGTNDTERMRIDPSGNVGIGSTSPSTYGDSGGGPNIVVQSTGTGRGVLVFASQQTGGADEALGKINFIDSDSTNTAFRGAGIIGVRGSDANSAYLVFNTANSGNGAERMRLNVDGYLLVGYTASNGAYKLQVNSQIFATSATIATSDGRYKENVTPLTGALDIVKALNPVQFQWKQHPVHNFDRSCPTVGFIAQEVQQVLADKPYLNSIIKANECEIEPAQYETIVLEPAVDEVKDDEGNIIVEAKEAVTERRLIKEAVKEDFYGIAEGNMIAILTKALQEATAKIETLEAKVAALEAK